MTTEELTRSIYEANCHILQLTDSLNAATRERDEARAEVEKLRKADDESALVVLRLARELHEARAEVERLSDASTHWQVMLKRETEEVERLERELQIERMGIRPIDEVRCDAYRRGAEAMREECAGCIKHLSHEDGLGMGSQRIEGAVRALPIPGEP